MRLNEEAEKFLKEMKETIDGLTGKDISISEILGSSLCVFRWICDLIGEGKVIMIVGQETPEIHGILMIPFFKELIEKNTKNIEDKIEGKE